MIKVFTTPGCLGCRYAVKFLKENGIDYEEKDFLKIPLTPKELKDILSLSDNGFDDILSDRSKIYKKFCGEIEDLSIDETIKLIIKNPQILSRPILVQYINNNPYRLLVGYNSNDIEIFLNSDTYKQSKINKVCSLQNHCKINHDHEQAEYNQANVLDRN